MYFLNVWWVKHYMGKKYWAVQTEKPHASILRQPEGSWIWLFIVRTVFHGGQGWYTRLEWFCVIIMAHDRSPLIKQMRASTRFVRLIAFHGLLPNWGDSERNALPLQWSVVGSSEEFGLLVAAQQCHSLMLMRIMVHIKSPLGSASSHKHELVPLMWVLLHYKCGRTVSSLHTLQKGTTEKTGETGAFIQNA